MNTSDNAKCVSTLGLIMGVFMLMTMAAPSAHAVIQDTKFTFENAAARAAFNLDFNLNPYPADSGSGFLRPGPDNAFVNGQITIDSTGGNTGGVLDLQGNPSPEYCFSIGAINTAGQPDVTLSFDLLSAGNGGQFSTLKLAYSTTGTAGSFTALGTTGTYNGTTGFTDLQAHTSFFTYTVDLTAGGAPSSSTLYVEFCLSGSKNDANQNFTLIDNISITGTPEPTTVIGGMLAAVGLCWNQRKRLSAVLRARLA
jgi:hypothetical protein